MTTTKSYLIHAVAEANGFPQNNSAEIVETLIDLIKTKFAAGEVSDQRVREILRQKETREGPQMEIASDSNLS